MSAVAVPASAPASPPAANPRPAGKLFMAIGFAVTSITGAGLTYAGQRFYLDYQNQQSDMFAKVSAFEKQSGELIDLVDALNRRILSGKDAQAQRDAVAANAREQYQTLTDALPYIPPERAASAQNYLNIMSSMTQEVQKFKSPLTAGPFLQEFEYSAVARDEIVGALRKQAGLPVTSAVPTQPKATLTGRR